MEVEPLLRESVSSFGDGASFWPDTCFVEIDTNSVLDRKWEQKPETVVTASGLFHEYIHWTQCHSTTFGVFSYLLRHKRAEIIECFLRSLDQDRRADALAKWREGKPIWRFGVEDSRADLSIACQRLSTHWDALTIFDQIFRRSHPALSKKFDLRKLFKTAYLHTDGSYSREELFQSDEPYFSLSLPDQESSVSTLQNLAGTLSCRALEECAAFLNQREFYSNAEAIGNEAGAASGWSQRLEQLHSTRWETHLKDPSKLYSACIAYFCEENESLDINDTPVLLALLIIIDIALNPPLPPFASLEDRFVDVSQVLFSEGDLLQTHPVLRFMRLSQVVRTIGPPTEANIALFDAGFCKSYVDRLCRESGLMNPSRYLLDFPKADSGSFVWDDLEDSPLKHLKKLVLSHHLKGLSVRERWPLCFAAPAHHLLYLPAFKEFLTRDRLETVFIAPLQIISGAGFFAGIEEEEYWRVLRSAAFAHALSSLLCGQAQFYEDGLPRDDLHNATVKRAQADLVRRLTGVA